MRWVLLKWTPTTLYQKLPRFRNMYDIMTEEQWLSSMGNRLAKWTVVTATDTEQEAHALLNLMPKYNDDTQTS